MSDSNSSPATSAPNGPANWIAEAQRAARRAASPPSTCDDLAQESLARALAHPPLRQDASMGAWIERICRNLRVDCWRAEARARELGDQLMPPAAEATGEESLLARERRREVRRALCALPRPQRRALILRFFAGWSFERIGKRLGMSEGTARTRVHRALLALRAHVGTLRTLIFPHWPAFKPALAALVLLIAQPPAAQRAAIDVSALAGGAETTDASTQARRHASRPRRPPETDVLLAMDDGNQAEASAHSDPAAVDDGANGRRARSVHARPVVPSPAAPVKRIDFDDGDEIAGDLLQPDEAGPIVGTTNAVQPSLIELRPHFQIEILKTLEDL